MRRTFGRLPYSERQYRKGIAPADGRKIGLMLERYGETVKHKCGECKFYKRTGCEKFRALFRRIEVTWKKSYPACGKFETEKENLLVTRVLNVLDTRRQRGLFEAPEEE